MAEKKPINIKIKSVNSDKMIPESPVKPTPPPVSTPPIRQIGPKIKQGFGFTGKVH